VRGGLKQRIFAGSKRLVKQQEGGGWQETAKVRKRIAACPKKKGKEEEKNLKTSKLPGGAK
jgi:hypothetical protein